MKNPLIRRIPRELKSDFGKYLVIFLFMIMLISLVSGYVVSTNSLLTAYDESFEKYNVEHGHVTFDKAPPAGLLAEIESRGELELYDLRYFEEDFGDGKTARVYPDRGTVDKVCVMKGEIPAADDEIALDRMFAENNEINVGDTITIRGRTLKVTALIALPDYSSLFKNNTDMMFDALNFTVAVMTEGGFEAVGSPRVHYNYAWRYNEEYDRNDKVRANERSEALIEALRDIIEKYDKAVVEEQVKTLTEKLEAAGKEYAELYLKNGKAPAKTELSVGLSDFLFGIVEGSVKAQLSGEEYAAPSDEEFENEIDKTDIIGIEDYVPLYRNNAVNFTGKDMGDDKAMFILFDYIVTAVLAFIFAVTISGTITAEAGVIGTLRASGYSRGEITRHYLVLPVVITLIAAVIGNVLGYTLFEKVFAQLFYHSYSLTTYVVLWNMDAFITTTVVPFILMFIINLLVISVKLRLSPLQFLRRELKKNPKKKAFRLNTKIPFLTRFRLRIIFRNKSSYIVMIFGIILGAAVVILGDIFGTIFEDYSKTMLDDVICEYQYVLTEPLPTDNSGAEKYCMTSFDFTYKDFMTDEVSVYGIEDGSRYVSADVADGRIAVSSTVAKKYRIGAGDEITLTDPYSNDGDYTFTVDSVYDYEVSLSVFMSRESFNRTFGESSDHFTGYFSNEELTGFDSDKVAAVITVKDLTKVADQMEHSIGGFLKYLMYFGVIMFVLIMFILSKQVIERNFQSISMCKILGFRNGEISSLYIVSTSVSVIAGLLLAIPLTEGILRWAFNNYLYKVVTGYFPYNIRPDSFIRMILLGMASYAVVAVIQMLKINRVSKSDALKNTE